MAKGLTFDNQFLALIFNQTTNATLFSAAGSLTNLYVSLHTADPTSAGTQSSSEVAYSGYVRAIVPRTSGGWTVTSNSVVPAAPIPFPLGTGGSGTVTNWAVGTLSTGAGEILYTGTVTPNIVVGAGVTPSLTVASSITET